MQVCRGLLDAHKLIFSFLICTSIQRHAGTISPVAWSFFLRGGRRPESSRPNADPSWISAPVWDSILSLDASIPSFSGLPRSLLLKPNEWKQWKSADDLFRCPPPSLGLDKVRLLALLAVYYFIVMLAVGCRMVSAQLSREGPPSLFSL